MDRCEEQQEAIRQVRILLDTAKKEAEGKVSGELDELVWETLKAFQGECFYTAKGLEYSYRIKGNEMFVDRKDKSITRATVTIALENAVRLQRFGNVITGPKRLGTFGTSYLYPIFLRIGLIEIPEV